MPLPNDHVQAQFQSLNYTSTISVEDPYVKSTTLESGMINTVKLPGHFFSSGKKKKRNAIVLISRWVGR